MASRPPSRHSERTTSRRSPAAWTSKRAGSTSVPEPRQAQRRVPDRRLRSPPVRLPELHERARRRVHDGSRVRPRDAQLPRQRHAQAFVNASPTIFLAEIASTFNEELLLNHLLEKRRERRREEGAARETAGEHPPHDLPPAHVRGVRAGHPRRGGGGRRLTAERLNEIYGALIRKYYGPASRWPRTTRSSGPTSRTSTTTSTSTSTRRASCRRSPRSPRAARGRRRCRCLPRPPSGRRLGLPDGSAAARRRGLHQARRHAGHLRPLRRDPRRARGALASTPLNCGIFRPSGTCGPPSVHYARIIPSRFARLSRFTTKDTKSTKSSRAETRRRRDRRNRLMPFPSFVSFVLFVVKSKRVSGQRPLGALGALVVSFRFSRRALSRLRGSLSN
jgi:hypothetical protein